MVYMMKGQCYHSRRRRRIYSHYLFWHGIFNVIIESWSEYKELNIAIFNVYMTNPALTGMVAGKYMKRWPIILIKLAVWINKSIIIQSPLAAAIVFLELWPPYFSATTNLYGQR